MCGTLDTWREELTARRPLLRRRAHNLVPNMNRTQKEQIRRIGEVLRARRNQRDAVLRNEAAEQPKAAPEPAPEPAPLPPPKRKKCLPSEAAMAEGNPPPLTIFLIVL